MTISISLVNGNEIPSFLLSKLGEYYQLFIEEFENVLSACECAGIAYKCCSLSNGGFYFSVTSSNDITVNYSEHESISVSGDALGLAITHFLLWSLGEDGKYNDDYWSLVEKMEGVFPLVIDFTHEHPERSLIDDFIYGIIHTKLKETGSQ